VFKAHFPVYKDFPRRYSLNHINSLHIQRPLSWTFVFILPLFLSPVSQNCPFLSCFCTKISYISYYFLASSETIFVIWYLPWKSLWRLCILKSVLAIFIGISINVVVIIIIYWSLFVILTAFPHQANEVHQFLFSNFHPVLNVVCLLLGNSPASEFYMPTFRNTVFHLYRRIGMRESFIPIRLWRWNRPCSETSEYKIQISGNYPEESIQSKFCFIHATYVWSLFPYCEAELSKCDIISTIRLFHAIAIFRITCWV
jgi:hypothetical protein